MYMYMLELQAQDLFSLTGGWGLGTRPPTTCGGVFQEFIHYVLLGFLILWQHSASTTTLKVHHLYTIHVHCAHMYTVNVHTCTIVTNIIR